MSGGKYQLNLRRGGSVTTGAPEDCVAAAAAAARGTGANGAIIVASRPIDGAGAAARLTCRGGVGMPFGCDAGTTYPANGRHALVPIQWVRRSPARELLHEVGHTLGWPHIQDNAGDPYGVPGELMSGLGSNDTAAINLYAAGWVGLRRVATAAPDSDTTVLLGSRIEMLVVHTTSAGAAFTVERRASGVFVHAVDERPQACGRPVGGLPCLGLDRLVRRIGGPLGDGDRIVLDPRSIGATGIAYVVSTAEGGAAAAVTASPRNPIMWGGG